MAGGDRNGINSELPETLRQHRFVRVMQINQRGAGRKFSGGDKRRKRVSQGSLHSIMWLGPAVTCSLPKLWLLRRIASHSSIREIPLLTALNSHSGAGFGGYQLCVRTSGSTKVVLPEVTRIMYAVDKGH